MKKYWWKCIAGCEGNVYATDEVDALKRIYKIFNTIVIDLKEIDS